MLCSVISVPADEFKGSADREQTPRYFTVPLDRNSQFVERKDLSQALDQYFGFTGSQQRGGERVTLVGMSGSGKTELAVRFTEEHRRDYQAIFWLDCSNENRLNDSLMYIAETISLTTIRDFRLAKSFCQNWLQTHNQWLLIADSLDDDKMIHDFGSHLLRGGMNGSILITSTNSLLSSFWDGIEVSDMTLPECHELLRNIARDNSSGAGNSIQDLNHLVEELGRLPLAIDQAGCYMQQQSITAREYLQLFKSHQKRLLSQLSSRLYHHSMTESVWTALTLSYDRLLQFDSAASQLLFLLALLKAESIPLKMLIPKEKIQGYWSSNGEFEIAPLGQQWIPNGLEETLSDETSIREAITDLRRFSLIRWNRNHNSISMHPLIQRWTIAKMSESSELTNVFKRCAVGVVCSALEKQDIFPPLLPKISNAREANHIEERQLSPWPWRRYTDLSSHALQCLQHACDLPYMYEVTASQSLALLQFLQYNPYGTSIDDHHTFTLEIINAVERSFQKGQNSLGRQPASDGFIAASIHVWRLVASVSCSTFSKAYVVGMSDYCRSCPEAHNQAQEHFLVATSPLNIFRPIVRPRKSCRYRAVLLSLGRLLAESPIVLGKREAINIRPLLSALKDKGWIEQYTCSVTRYYELVLEKSLEEKDELDLATAVKSFDKIIGNTSEEYRRSVWHLTTLWYQGSRWTEIRDVMRPLVMQSIREPVTDWSHERCIIRLASVLWKLGQKGQAAELLRSVKTAYDKQGKTLRTIQNSMIFCNSGDESTLTVVSHNLNRTSLHLY
jgi:hypothetical protein